MLKQAEKFAAIERLFPRIPVREKARLAAQMIHLDNVGALAFHYAMHTATKYDSMLHGKTNPYEAREIVAPQVRAILSTWS